MQTSDTALKQVCCPHSVDAAQRAAEADLQDELAFRRNLVAGFNRKLESQGLGPSAVMLERQRRFVELGPPAEEVQM